jgi:cytochrome P450
LEPSTKERWRALPGNDGPPLLGHAVAFFGDPLRFARERQARFGAVSRLSFFGKAGALLIGPEANQFVTKDDARIFSSVLAYEPFMKDFFPGTLGVKDFDDHARHRRILQSAFHRKSLVSYLETLNPLAAEQVASLPTGRVIRFFPRVKDLLLEQAARLFMGQSLDERSRALGKEFIALVTGSASTFRVNLPGTSFRRGLVAKERLWSFLGEQLPGRRATLTADLFSHVAHAESEEGERLTDDEVVGHMLGLMSAAHDTNASAMTSMVYALARHPEIQERMRAECLAYGDTAPDFDGLKNLTYTANVFRETLRLWGPSHSLPRVALKSFSFAGHEIPEQTMVFVSPSCTHRLEAHWKDPDTFDPDRFAAPREEQKAHRYLFMPFGGGAHGCLGIILAEMQAKVFFWHFLRRYRIALEKPGRDYALAYTPMPMPKDGLRVVLTPLAASTS